MDEIKIPYWVDEVNNLTAIQKLSIYMDYYITHLGLKYNFYIDFKYHIEKYPNPNFEKKTIIGIEKLRYLWENINIDDFDKFISPENIVVHDFGEDWKDHYCAQRFNVNAFGIYDWFCKFKHRINL